jgi:hypothetical protein
VDPRAGLDDVENRKFLTLPGLELRPLGSQSLYRLHIFPAPAVLVENYTKLNSVVLVLKRTIPTERPQPVGEVSANFS